VPVAVTALRGAVNDRGDFLFTALPVVDLEALPAGPVTIAQFAQGAGWTTQVVLVNKPDGADPPGPFVRARSAEFGSYCRGWFGFRDTDRIRASSL
jgi:hypothetical protein